MLGERERENNLPNQRQGPHTLFLFDQDLCLYRERERERERERDVLFGKVASQQLQGFETIIFIAVELLSPI